MSIDLGSISEAIAGDSSKYIEYNFYSTNAAFGVNLSLTMGSHISLSSYNLVNQNYHLITNVSGKVVSYAITDMRIYKKSHKITDFDFAAEVVFKMKSDDGTSTAYFVIPLSNNNGNTILDTILLDIANSSTKQRQISFNKLLGEQTDDNLRTLYYTADKDPFDGRNSTAQIFILTEPIAISTVSAAFISKYCGTYKTFKKLTGTTPTILSAGNTRGPKSGGAADVYIDCSADEKAADTSGAKYGRLSGKQIRDLCISFLVLLVWVAFCYFIKLALNYFKEDKNYVKKQLCAFFANEIIRGEGQKPGTTTGDLILYFIFVLFLTILGLFFYSFSKRDMTTFMVAIYLMTVMLGIVYVKYGLVTCESAAAAPAPAGNAAPAANAAAQNAAGAPP